MRSANRWRRILARSLAVLWIGVAAGTTEAAEEAQRFLDGLRLRGYYDVALEYLEQARTNPLVSQEFKTTIDYEAGVTLMENSRLGRVASVQEQQLGEARDRFTKFLNDYSDHPLAAGANTQLANLLVERGKIKASQAAKPDRPEVEKKQLLEEARKLYVEAQTVFVGLESRFSAAHKEFPKLIDKNDTKQIEARDQVRLDLLQARLALATVVHEIAQTHEPGSAEAKKNLEEAAAKYALLYENYGTRLAGLYARMWEGRCYRELGETEKAYEAFEDLLQQTDDRQSVRDMKAKAIVLLLETTLLPGETTFEKGLAEAVNWEEDARGREETSPDGLAIKYLAGDVALQYARSLKKKDDADKKTDTINQARKFFKAVASLPGEYQKQAKAKLRQAEFGGTDGELPEPIDFAEANDRALDELDRMQDTSLGADEIAAARDEAIKYFRLAITMRTPETSAEDMNLIRYRLAYLYWMAGDVYEAAVIGEFLARRYPNAMGGRQGAKIAMAAYAKMAADAQAARKKAQENPGDLLQAEIDEMAATASFANRRMVDVAEYITDAWAGQPEAAEAWMMLIRTAVIEGDLDSAMQIIEKIAPDAPGRGGAELMVGQALWSRYVKATILPEDQRPEADELTAQLAEARSMLEAGVGRQRTEVENGVEVTYSLVASILSLAQMNINAGEMEEAVAWLEAPKVGALTLVEAEHPVTDRGNFRVETYKAALRAYVSVQELEKAEAVMKSLESQGGDDPDGGGNLTRIYISLGRQLEEMLNQLRLDNNQAKVAQVTKGFELFLDRIAGREQGNTFNSLNWAAETYFSLGNSKLGSEAIGYYEKAAKTYQKILQQCKAYPSFATQPNATLIITLRLAACYRHMGDYSNALKLVLAILKSSERPIVSAQLEAAYSYQAWGEEKPTAYKLAIMGSEKHREIWGWGRIAARVIRSPDHMHIFHEARYNLAYCRFQWALSMSSTEKKAMLAQAEKDILIIERLYPDMGGAGWRGKYDDLLRKIQKMRRVKVTGLKPLETE
ncbi:MAG: hypothetical protein V3R99_13380 [Thermoguttaceae bacterium]